jgi:hypothetical protein
MFNQKLEDSNNEELRLYTAGIQGSYNHKTSHNSEKKKVKTLSVEGDGRIKLQGFQDRFK